MAREAKVSWYRLGMAMVLCAPMLAAAIATGPTLGAPYAPSTDESRLLTPLPADVLAADAMNFKNLDVALANPFFEGRAPGTRGNVLAAEYVEFHLKKLRLKPAFPVEVKDLDGNPVSTPFSTYRQPFQLGSTTRADTQECRWSADGAPVTLTPGTDFNVLVYSGDAEADAPLAFAGYSITTGKDGYATYEAGDELKGKIAIILRFEPMNDEGKSKWAERRWSYLASIGPKIGQAVKHGAAAVILVNPPDADDERTGKLEDMESLPLQGAVQKVPVIMMSTDAADSLVKAADPLGRSLLDLRRLADETGGVIDLPKATVRVKAGVERSPIMTDNVGAILPGRGTLAEEYVVIGAHYDHVGYGLFGSRDPQGTGKLHPGADDNASGTSGMLVIAEKMAAAYAKAPADVPLRSVLFMGFTGEESGLNGSRHYTRNMIADKSKHYLMINLDMIGRLKDDKLELSGVGTAEGMEEWVRPYSDSSGLKIASKHGGTGPSDHASFFAAGIPVLFFFTGLHEQYHMPTDTSDLINAQGAAQVIDMAYRIGFDAARRPEPFPYVADPRSKTKEPDDDKAADPGPVAVGVRFGITPGDYNDEKPGVLVGDVAEGWSAHKGGIKKGDRITKWNGKEVENVESWMPFLSAAKPGDKVQVTVERDGQELTLEVTLMARDSGVK